MISDRDLASLRLLSGPINPNAPAYPRSECERWMIETATGKSGGWEIVDVQTCECCGDPTPLSVRRCAKHRDRNPCVIEGCKRTTDAKGNLRNDQWICSEHWRRYVPPHSPTRRAYHRFFRLAKRRGWDDDLSRRFWRFWDGLVKRVRRQSTEGQIDEGEINRLFGWD